MKIMLIDDEAPILDFLNDILTQEGHKCESFQNPLKALEAYGNGGFDVVLTDVRMPELSGIETLKRIRQQNPEAKVIIFTGYGDLKTAISAINNRAYAFFPKPINIAELFDTLKKIAAEIDGTLQKEQDCQKLSEELKKLQTAYDELKAILKKQEKLKK